MSSGNGEIGLENSMESALDGQVFQEVNGIKNRKRYIEPERANYTVKVEYMELRRDAKIELKTKHSKRGKQCCYKIKIQ